MNNIKINIDDKYLKVLEKKLLQDNYITKVGVIGSGKYENGQTIASVGLTQELGSITKNIPARSFLKKPLQRHLKERIINSKKLLNSLFDEKEPLKTSYEYLGGIGQVISQESFDNKGDGTWAPNAPATIAKKGVNNPLIDQRILSKAITYEVVEK